VPSDNPENRISDTTWAKIAADIERLALSNDHLKRVVEELHQTCLKAFNENERMKKLLRDHGIPFAEPDT
jgi:hypothetical protein